MSTDNYVQLPLDGPGQKVATTTKTDANANTVNLQQVVLADPIFDSGLARVDSLTGQLSAGDPNVIDLLSSIDLKLSTLILAVYSLRESSSGSRRELEIMMSQQIANF